MQNKRIDFVACKRGTFFMKTGAVFLMCLLLAVFFCLCGCGRSSQEKDPGDFTVPDEVIKEPELEKFESEHKTVTRAGYSAEYLGTVERKIPVESKDGGLVKDGVIAQYPVYDHTLSLTAEQKNAIISESWSLCSVNTRVGSDGYPKNTFDKMDADGRLYLNGEDTGKTLYKHTSAAQMYRGDVSPDEPGIVKKISVLPRSYGYSVTGVYAPAGEVIKIQISEKDMTATGGIVIHIGQALYNAKANNIWAQRNINRMPVILNTMVVNTNTATLENGVYTAYVGSFLGGPVYVRNNNRTGFSVTVSGGVRYSHFILGYTTPEEFAENEKSSAPYFDLEVWDSGVLHSGPAINAKGLSYEDLYKVAVYWDKVALVSTQVSTQGIVFLYDPFVAAGAAVAFPGQQSVNCPSGWMRNSLNYNGLVTSGAWGNMHEYNHNFQSGWGIPGGGEVTNNALTLVEYSLFTKISAARIYGGGSDGMGGWNRYTNASWALYQTLNGTENFLRVYATLLHNFGQEPFMSAIRLQRSGFGQSYAGYYKALSEATHNDMTYFFNDVLNANLDVALTNSYAEKNYSKFVPVASVYQTGRSYMYDGEKRYTQTMRPYVIPYGEKFEANLSKYVQNGLNISGGIVLPDEFTHRVKNVTQPEHGSVSWNADTKILTYTPDTAAACSVKIFVTLEITKNDGAYGVDDVDLVFEFEQSHEKNKTILERKIYTFDSDKYDSAVSAFESDYEGYTDLEEIDSVNKVQNSNSDVWLSEFPGEHKIMEVSGKIYIDEPGKYRIAFRGRWNCALYLSFDEGKTFEKAATIVKSDNGNGFNTNNSETFMDCTLDGDKWVYFKEIMLVEKHGGTLSFFGLGFGKFETQGTIDEEGNIIDAAGNKLPAGSVLPETVSVKYASAYRNDYEFSTDEFVTDYFYTRNYSYSYNDTKQIDTNQTLVSVVNFTAAASRLDAEGNIIYDYKIENLFDGNPDTNIHSQNVITESNPFEITVDLGKTVKANRMTLYGNTHPAGMQNLQIPVDFALYGSLDGTEFFALGEYTNQRHVNSNITVSFDEAEFRFYKLTVTRTNPKYIALNAIGFTYEVSYPNGKIISPDSEFLEYRGAWNVKHTASTYGHVYESNGNAMLSFEFEGKRVGIISANPLGGNIEVIIDGEKAESVELKEDLAVSRAVYISSELSSGKHEVIIVCSGNANIDSLVVW